MRLSPEEERFIVNFTLIRKLLGALLLRLLSLE